MTGNHIEHEAVWTSGSDLSRLAGRAVKLRFVMKDAELYARRSVDQSEKWTVVASAQPRG